MKLIKKTIHPKYNTQIKFSNLYYLTMMFFMLNNVNNQHFLYKGQEHKKHIYFLCLYPMNTFKVIICA